ASGRVGANGGGAPPERRMHGHLAALRAFAGAFVRTLAASRRRPGPAGRARGAFWRSIGAMRLTVVAFVRQKSGARRALVPEVRRMRHEWRNDAPLERHFEPRMRHSPTMWRFLR